MTQNIEDTESSSSRTLIDPIENIQQLKKESKGWIVILSTISFIIVLASTIAIYKFLQIEQIENIDGSFTKVCLLTILILIILLSFIFSLNMLRFYMKLHSLYSLQIFTYKLKVKLCEEYIAKEKKISLQYNEEIDVKRWIEELYKLDYENKNNYIDSNLKEKSLFIKNNFIDRLSNINNYGENNKRY